MSKQDEIVSYIKMLDPGSKISVRTIASQLGVSEGTAYRAIKESENIGIVSTIPRVGTVRVERAGKKNTETLTFADVVKIIDGVILGGKDGLYKKLNKLVIGAMTVEAFTKYVVPGCLTIVGNRERIQRYALENEAAVLISGGFSCSEEIKNLANEKMLPVISSTYDTFTIASMINQAIQEIKLKKDIIFVEEIMDQDLHFIKESEDLETWKELVINTKHTRYPVVNDDMRVVGIITAKDMPIDNMDKNETIKKFMRRDPITVTPKTTVSYAANIMGGEDIELCPVVDGRKLVGVITRKDVIKALKTMDDNSQMVDNLEDTIFNSFQCTKEGENRVYRGNITPQMIDSMGTASWGILNMIITSTALRHVNDLNINVAVDNISIYFMRPAQLGTAIVIRSTIIDIGRSSGKLEIAINSSKGEIIGKAMVSVKILKK